MILKVSGDLDVPLKLGRLSRQIKEFYDKYERGEGKFDIVIDDSGLRYTCNVKCTRGKAKAGPSDIYAVRVTILSAVPIPANTAPAAT